MRCQVAESRLTIATQSRTRSGAPAGFVFRHCRLTGAEGARVFFGRPWRSCARVAYLDCWMGGHIRPEGWDDWNNAANE
jgi:pectinesterase